MDTRVAEAIKALYSFMMSNDDVYRRLGYIRLAWVLASLDNTIKTNRRKGRLVLKVGNGDASVAIDMH